MKGKVAGVSGGYISYRLRSKLRDEHGSDDRVYLEFRTNKVEYRYLKEIALYYISSFGAYRMGLYPEDLIFVEKDVPFDITMDLNFRKDIEEFYPLHYMDAMLVKRALNLDLNDFFNKLNGNIYNVELVGNGVLIQAKDGYASVEECIELNRLMEKVLEIRLPVFGN